MQMDYVVELTKRGERVTRTKIQDVTTKWGWWDALKTRLLKIARSAAEQEFGQADRISEGPSRKSLTIVTGELETHAEKYQEIIGLCREVLSQIDPTKINVLMRIGVFKDASGSCKLGRHTDIHNEKLKLDYSLWHFFLALQVPHGAAETRFHVREGPQCKFNTATGETDMMAFDSMQKHSAAGNTTAQDNLKLQLVFVTDCLLEDGLGRKEVREQFNDKKDIEDTTTQVGYCLKNLQ